MSEKKGLEMNAPSVALSVRQPWAELIMRGIKTIEVRSVILRKRERIYIYASLGKPDPEDLASAQTKYRIEPAAFVRGVIVGTVDLVDCRFVTAADSDAAGFPIDAYDKQYGWFVARPERLAVPREPTGRPQPMFFRPWPE